MLIKVSFLTVTSVTVTILGSHKRVTVTLLLGPEDVTVSNDICVSCGRFTMTGNGLRAAEFSVMLEWPHDIT